MHLRDEVDGEPTIVFGDLANISVQTLDQLVGIRTQKVCDTSRIWCRMSCLCHTVLHHTNRTVVQEDEWTVCYTAFSAKEEMARETLSTISNGYFGTRGAVSETTAATKAHYPGVYISGVYNTLPTDIANRTIHNEDLVNCPNWLMLNYRIDDGFLRGSRRFS